VVDLKSGKKTGLVFIRGNMRIPCRTVDVVQFLIRHGPTSKYASRALNPEVGDLGERSRDHLHPFVWWATSEVDEPAFAAFLGGVALEGMVDPEREEDLKCGR
jgi:hypothetical protein